MSVVREKRTKSTREKRTKSTGEKMTEMKVRVTRRDGS